MSSIASKVLLIWVLQAILAKHQTFAHSPWVGFGNGGDSVIDTDSVHPRDTSSIGTTDLSSLWDGPASTDTFTLSPPSNTSSMTDYQIEAAIKPNVDSKSSSSPNEVYDQNLRLQSSSSNITAVNGYILYASPIMSAELLALLLATHNNLNTYRGRNDVINHYQLNYTAWSFEVIVANGTLHYASISSIVTRFLQLMPNQQVNNSIMWTRVGCLYHGDKPIADVAIVPLSTDQEPIFANVSSLAPAPTTSTPLQIMTISPTSVINSTEIISPDVLDIYSTSQLATLPKRQASALERQVILKVYNTALYVTLHILRHPDGWISRTVVVFFIVAIYVAVCKYSLGVLAELVSGSWGGNHLGEIYGFDSGIWRLGQLSARFMMKATSRDREGRLASFDATQWEAIATTIVAPLKLAGKGDEVYAVGGEIRGPDPANNKTGELVKLGEWQLTAEPVLAGIHDEL